MRRSMLLLSFFLFAFHSLFAEEAPGFLDSLNVYLHWEPARKMGMLTRGDDNLIFHTDSLIGIQNYKKKVYLGDIWYSTEGLRFSERAEKEIRALFPDRPESDLPRFSKIFIDPGHGGDDPGTLTTHSLPGEELVLIEKYIVLELALLLHDQLRRTFPDKKIILSRSDDTTTKLIDRSEMANRHASALGENEHMMFISLHANFSFNQLAKGYEVWYLPPESEREALAKKKSGDAGLDTMLNLIMTEELNKESEDLAHFIIDALNSELGDETRNRGAKQEEFSVVRRTNMASVLVEIGFISNIDEARNLLDSIYLQKLSNGIYNGVLSFVEYYEAP